VKSSRRSKSKPKVKRSAVSHRQAKSQSASPQHELPRLPKNLQATVERVVEFQSTIAAYNPDLPAIFSTPAMIGMMEVAAAKSIQDHLPSGTISVGTRIEVDHRKAVPQGTKVQAHARLIGNKGRFLVFEVEARAGDLLIGSGRVYRAIMAMPSPNNASRS
jgi:fluoroacetyl-CoA thioesterase